MCAGALGSSTGLTTSPLLKKAMRPAHDSFIFNSYSG